jgi:hypothetical protein
LEEVFMHKPTSVKVLISMGWFAFLAILAFWIAWFVSPGLVQSRMPADPDYGSYVAFEQAFILADSWLAMNGLLGALGLMRMRPWGFLCMLLAGGSGVFLGLMDLLYDLQHAVFTRITSASVIELVIVIFLLTFSPLVILLTWRQRKYFIKP